jgi:hypothetical protein
MNEGHQMLTLTKLQELFPATGTNQAVAGRIPMTFFRENELGIAVVVKENQLRRIYRGRGQGQNCTKNCADYVLLYIK